jgi:hypothetical protein
LPEETPVTTPPDDTVATPVLLLLHVPPVVASLNVVVEPIHSVAVPVIADTGAVILTMVVAVHPAALV